MQSTPEAREALKTALNEKRMQTFGMLRQLSTATPELLKAFGYKGQNQRQNGNGGVSERGQRM